MQISKGLESIGFFFEQNDLFRKTIACFVIYLFYMMFINGLTFQNALKQCFDSIQHFIQITSVILAEFKETVTSMVNIIGGETKQPEATITNTTSRSENSSQTDRNNNRLHNRIDQSLMCYLCRENVRNVVLIPCNHLCVCSLCCDPSQNSFDFHCPICANLVTDKLRIVPQF